MTAPEMHVWFRQYAQQMGMQNVRAILPEQIDVCINTSISDVVNQLVRENVGIRNDRAIAEPTKIGQINALRSLYKTVELPMTGIKPFMEFLAVDANTGKISNKKENGTDVSTTVVPEFLYLVDFAIKYKVTLNGYTGVGADLVYPTFAANAMETQYFPVRLVEESYLAESLNDFVLKNRITSPIIVTYNDGTFDLYISKFIKKDINNTIFYQLVNSLIPFKIKVSYIAKPAIVKYESDINGTNVDCDLPESLHIDILKHAVDLYRASINGGASTQQSQYPQVNRPNQPTQEG